MLTVLKAKCGTTLRETDGHNAMNLKCISAIFFYEQSYFAQKMVRVDIRK